MFRKLSIRLCHRFVWLLRLLCTRYAIYATVLCLTLYTSFMLYITRSGLYIQCRCYSETQTQERVDRYLPTLLQERNFLTQRSVAEDAEQEHPSLPVKFLSHFEASGKRCELLPGLFDIKHRNSLWQEAQIGSSMFLLFSAYIDYRDKAEGPLIRILSMADNGWPSIPTCHLYHSNDPSRAPVATKAIRVDYINWQYPEDGKWHPYMITCRAGIENSNPPEVVSLVSDPCSLPTNALRVNHYKESQQKEKKLALCHKFLFNPAQDYSFRIIEWLEIARALGVDDVTMYISAIHPNVKKVLDHYRKSGYLKIIPWTNPGDQLNIPSLLRALFDTQRYVLFANENIPYTDCLLKHIGSHKYVGVWDIDEFIFPANSKYIPDMIEEAYVNWKTIHDEDPMPNPPTSYLARSSYFLDDNIDSSFLDNEFIKLFTSKPPLLFQNGTANITKIERYFPILSHTIRTLRVSPPRVFTKSIHDTSRALGLHAHFALYNLEGQINKYTDLYDLYPQNEGFLGHFRSKCQGEDQTDCNENFRPYLVNDKTMWNFAERIIPNVMDIITELKL